LSFSTRGARPFWRRPSLAFGMAFMVLWDPECEPHTLSTKVKKLDDRRWRAETQIPVCASGTTPNSPITEGSWVESACLARGFHERGLQGPEVIHDRALPAAIEMSIAFGVHSSAFPAGQINRQVRPEGAKSRSTLPSTLRSVIVYRRDLCPSKVLRIFQHWWRVRGARARRLGRKLPSGAAGGHGRRYENQ